MSGHPGAGPYQSHSVGDASVNSGKIIPALFVPVLLYIGALSILTASGLVAASPTTHEISGVSPPPNPYYVYGFVRFPNGTVAVGATVYVNDTTANTSQVTSTDAQGKYQVSALSNPRNSDNVTVVADYLGVFGTNNTTVRINGAGSGSWVNVTLTPSPLTASLSSSPASPFVNMTVTFTANARGGVPPYTYVWSFGDGSVPVTSSSNSITHSYNRSARFTANVSVQQRGGSPANVSTIVTVVPAPTLKLAWSPTTPLAGSSVNLFANLSLAGNGWRYFFTFGDGNASGLTNPGVNTATHVYSKPKTYMVNATAFNATTGYRVDSAKYSLTVLGGIVLTLGVTPAPTEVGVSTTFTSTVSSSAGTMTLVYDFGDGASLGPTHQLNVTHVYAKVGTVTASVSGTNATGIFAASQNVSVTVVPAVTVSLSAAPSSGAAPLGTTLTATPSNGVAPFLYTFKLGSALIAKQTGSTLHYTLNNSGNYTFTVIIQDSLGVLASGTTKVSVLGGKPPSPLTATLSGPSQGSPGSSLSFVVNASGGVPPYTYFWNFGDNQTLRSSTSIEAHSYASSGNYTVTVWVNDSAGKSYRVTHLVSISASPPSPGPGSILTNSFDLFLILLALIILALLLLLLFRRRKKPEEEEAMGTPVAATMSGAGMALGTGPAPPNIMPAAEGEAGTGEAATSPGAESVPELTTETPASGEVTPGVEPQATPEAEPTAVPETPAPSPEELASSGAPVLPVEPNPEASSPSMSPSMAKPETSQDVSKEEVPLSKKERRRRRRMQRRNQAPSTASGTAGTSGQDAPGPTGTPDDNVSNSEVDSQPDSGEGPSP